MLSNFFLKSLLIFIIPLLALAQTLDSEKFLFADSDHKLISEQSLLDLSADQLWQARNEIYARKGYRFKSEKAQTFFNKMPYYLPQNKPVVLNEIEQANLSLIRRFEEYITSNEDLEFETAYRIYGLDSEKQQTLIIRSCPAINCPEIGRLRNGCTVNNDYRLDKGEWVYVMAAECDGQSQPSGGYVLKKYLRVYAG